jgi:hypothetical protein
VAPIGWPLEIRPPDELTTRWPLHVIHRSQRSPALPSRHNPSGS